MLVCRAAQFFSCMEAALAFGCLTVFPGRELRPIPHSLHVDNQKSLHRVPHVSWETITPPVEWWGPLSQRASVPIETQFDFASQRLKMKQGLVIEFFSCLRITTGKAASLCQAIKVPDFFCYIARRWVLSFLPWYPHFNGQMLEGRWSEEGHAASLWSVFPV